MSILSTTPPDNIVDDQERDDTLRLNALELAVSLAKHSGGIDTSVVKAAAEFYKFLKGEGEATG